MKTLTYILILILLPLSMMAQVKTYSDDKKLSDSIFVLVNEYRVTKGLNTLKKSYKLKNNGRKHNIDMYMSDVHTTKELRHSDTKNKYNECVFFFSKADFAASSEEDALSFVLSDDITKWVMDGWKKSKGHNKVLVKEGLTKGAVDVKIKIIKGKDCFPRGSNVYQVIVYATYTSI